MSLLMCGCFLKLKTGADRARADDTNRLKIAIVNWLNNLQERAQPLLIPEDKLKHGFDHDITGQLLCPVDYDWLDILYESLIY